MRKTDYLPCFECKPLALDAPMKKGLLCKKSQVEREACSVCAARGWQENSPFVLSLEHRLSGGGGMTQELEGGRRQPVVFMGWEGYVPTREGGPPHPSY